MATTALLTSAGLQAADLAGVTLGTWVSGPKITTADLAGKVVIFEYWGVNCPPCVANIPHISDLAALADPDRLLVIANHCQAPGRTAQVWKEKNGSDRPVVIEDGNLPGSNVSGIPRIFVFDHNGSQVFDGHPGEVDEAMITKLLDAAPGPMVPKGDYPACKAEAAALAAKGGNIAGSLKSLRGKIEKGKDEATKAQAQQLLQGVQAYLDKKLASITAARSEDPAAAASALNKVLAQVKGDVLAKPFESLQAELKTDKAFQAECNAAEKLNAIKAALTKAGVDQGWISASKRNEALAAAVQAIDKLIKIYPNTRAAKDAAALRAKLAADKR